MVLFLSLVFFSDRQLISCSEDGSVRIWELREKQQLAAEPVPTGVSFSQKGSLFFFFSHMKGKRKLCIITRGIYSILQIGLRYLHETYSN